MTLPNGYTRLEYIESTGTQYINTGFLCKNSTRVVADIEIQTVSGEVYFCGAVPSPYFYPCVVRGNVAHCYGTGAATGDSITVGRHIFDADGNVLKVDGTVRATADAQSFSTTYPMAIFALTNKADGSSATYFAQIKLYSFQIYDNGTLVRDYIPCKNASGVVGLWDDVNSKFYANAGSGIFKAGEMPTDHKTLVNGTGHKITGGRCLVNGTGYEIAKGRTLVAGTGYDIKFDPAILTVTIKYPVGTRGYAQVHINGRMYSSAHYSKVDDVLSVEEGTIVNIHSHSMASGGQARITINGVTYGTSDTIEMNYALKSNATITLKWNDKATNDVRAGLVVIEEE